MAKDDANNAFDKDMILKWFKRSKADGTELNFAFGLASKPDQSGLVIHLRKPGEMLKKQLLAEPAIKRACFGTLTVVDSDVLLKPTKPLKGIVKSLKIKLRTEGMGKFHPVLVDADGKVLDEDELPDGVGDGDDEDIDVENPAIPQESAPPSHDSALDIATLKARLIAVGGQIKALGAAAAPNLSTDLMAAAQDFKNAEVEACAAALTRLETALAAPAPQSSAEKENSPDAKLKAILMDKVALIRAMPGSPTRAELGVLAKDAMQALSSGNLVAAATTLKALAAQMAAADKMQEPVPADLVDAPEDVLQIWRDAKESVDEGISKLQNALRGQNHPVLSRIADMGLNGVTDGNQTALAKALFEFNAATEADKAKFSKALRAQVETYAQFLGKDPVLALAENNPFGIVLPIRATLGNALRQIASACKTAA